MDQKLWFGRKMTRLYIRLATKLGEPEVRHSKRGMLVFCAPVLFIWGGWCFPSSGFFLLS